MKILLLTDLVCNIVILIASEGDNPKKCFRIKIS